MTESYSSRQRRQWERFLKWQKEEGTWEGPVQLSTMLQPHQMARIRWLARHVRGSVLEVGCNWGMILARVKGEMGIDLNPANVELARLLSPDREFQVGDIRRLPLADKQYDTVMAPEVLEHLVYPDEVHQAILELQRVARKRVLITTPYGEEDSHDAVNFKHRYLVDDTVIKQFRKWMPGASIKLKFGFVLIDWRV